MYHILYVDDEPGLRDIGKLFLEIDGEFTVDTLPSAINALDLLKSIRFDAIISDYQMPQMDGITFLKTLRAGNDDTPFIIFTGRGREEVVIEALNSGADFYLQKGGEPTAQFAELAHKIRHAISRRQADQTVKKSEQDYRHLIEHANEAIYVVQDGYVRMANPRSAEITGYSEQEILNQPFTLFVHPDDREMLLNRFKMRVNGEEVPSRYPFRLSSKDGTVRWVELSVTTLKWDGCPATLNFLTDITKRKLAEDALRDSEERYHQFFKTTLDSVFITTPDGQWIDFNEALVGVFGCTSREEVFGVPVASFYAHPEDRMIFRTLVERDGSVKEHPIQFRKRDGTVFDALITSVTLKNPGGSLRAFIGTVRDITNRKRTEDALRESEDRYHQFFRTTLDCVFISTPDGQWIDFNEATLKMFGYNSREEIAYVPIISLYVHPEERAAFLGIVERDGYVRERLVQFKRRDGTVFDSLVTIVPRKNPDGSLKEFIGTIRDITEQKLSEDALRDSEERYRLFFKTAQDSVFITTPDGHFIDFNDHLMERQGYTSREEVLALNSASIYAHPEERAAFLDLVKRTGHVKEYSLSFRKRDGTVFETLISIVPQKNPDGSVKSYIGTIRSVTERKRIEKELRESEERYRLIFESFEDLYYQTDTSGIITILSPSLYRLTGYSPEELIGKPVTTIYVNPESRKDLLDEIVKNGFVRDYEVLLRKRDGIRTPASLSANRIYNADGTPAGVAGILRDISRRKKAEVALRESEEKFRSLVEYALEGILILDLQGTVLFANTAAARTIGSESCTGLIGRNVMEFIAPESREDVMRDFAEVARGHDAYLAHYSILSAKGEKIPVESIGKIITYEGKPADLISIRKFPGDGKFPKKSSPDSPS